MKDELLTIAKLDEAAQTHASKFATSVLMLASPEYRRKFEEALSLSFQRGALWALKTLETEKAK